MVNLGRHTIAGLQISSQRLMAARIAEPRYSPFTGVDFFLPFISHLGVPHRYWIQFRDACKGLRPSLRFTPEFLSSSLRYLSWGVFSKAVCCESLSSVAHFNAQPNTPILLLYPAITKMAGSDDGWLLAAQFNYPPCSST